MPSISSDDNDSLRALELSEGPARLKPSTRSTRSSTVSSVGGFEFRPDLFPLTLSREDDTEDAVPQKTVGIFNGIALVVGSQVGSGIFSSPGVVFANTRSVGASLLVWAVSGLLAWTGASSMAELGTTIPLSGGSQAYLAYAYNPMTSFLFSWTYISALKPGSSAIISLIFGEYVLRLFYPHDYNPEHIPFWQTQLLATSCVLISFILCVGSPRLGTRAAVFLTTIKLAALTLVAVLGIVQIARGRVSSSFKEPLFSGTSPNPSSFALAIYSGLWAFDGWDSVNFVTAEMENVARVLPKTIHSSMSIVLSAFLMANVSYFVVLDKDVVGRSNTIALDFGRTVLGAPGGVAFAVMVAISCLGASQGGFYTSSRLISAAGQEGFLPEVFGRLNSRLKTPLNATALHSCLTLLFIAFGGGFRSLINFYSVAGWGFYFLTVLGLLILRVKEPNLPRPYKTWITTPLIFSAVALFLLLMPIVAAPLEALAAVCFILAGVPIYFVFHRKRSSGAPGGFSLATFWQSCRRGTHSYTAAAQDEDDERVEMLEK